jgi:hypothetical protein
LIRNFEPPLLPYADHFGFFGFDYRIYAPVMLARAMWLRGFAAQACRLAKTAIYDTLSRVNPVSICVCTVERFAGPSLERRLPKCGEYAERLIA